jgi:hypothetical protein
MRTSSFLRGSLLVLFATGAGAGACNLITGADGLVLEEDLGSGPTGTGGGGDGGGPAVTSAATGGGGDGGGNTGTVTNPDNGALTDAGGVSITQVSIYQGVKVVLMENGQPGDGSVPVVAGRDALMRVWLSLDGNYNGKPVVARLRINGVEEVLQVTGVVTGSPVENNLGSTLNFQIPGGSIAAGFSFRVELLQPELDFQGANPAAYYPAQGYASTNSVDVGQTLKIVLVPVQYAADGSNRLPDTSANVIQGYKDLFYGMYPAPEIDLTIREPYPWNQDVSPNGYGWQELLSAIGQVRQQDGAAFDVYYYGIFSPTQSFGQFCGGGCVLGLGNLGGPGDAYSRAAIGIGFADDGGKTAWETAVHEIGHTHGRYHSPCGGAQGTDPNYPYSGAKLGVWGYHLLTQQLYDPNANTDVMGYCLPMWVSDFTYVGLLDRIKAVNQASIYVPPELKNRTYDRAWVDDAGELHWLPALKMELPPQGEPVELDVEADGGSYAVAGHYYPYDHLPGGVFVWPQASGPSAAITVQWKGSFKTLLAP